MEKSKTSSSEYAFQSFLLHTICEHGGVRMQLPMSDLTTFMQKLDPKDNVNLFRKQYGNMANCLKSIKTPLFELDSMIVKMKQQEEITKMAKGGLITKEDFAIYEKQFAANIEKTKETLKITSSNQCKVCGQVYKEAINQAGLCQDSGEHVPLYKL